MPKGVPVRPLRPRKGDIDISEEPLGKPRPDRSLSESLADIEGYHGE